MAASTTWDAFNDFVAEITPTESQQQTMRARRDRVHRILTDSFAGSNMPLLQTRLIGSAARKTITRPINDIDVLAVFNDSQVWKDYRGNSRRLLYRVRDKLNEQYTIQVVGARGQAVRLFYDQPPHVDIATVFPLDSGKGYVLPRGDGKWISTWPDMHDEFLDRRERELGEHLKRFTRMLKKWNAAHSARLRSFHLELIAQAVFNSISKDSRRNFEVFFQHAGSHLHVQDPAGHSGDLASYFGFFTQNEVKQSFSTALDRVKRARAAEAKGDHKTAIGIWSWIFGDQFPAYG